MLCARARQLVVRRLVDTVVAEAEAAVVAVVADKHIVGWLVAVLQQARIVEALRVGHTAAGRLRHTGMHTAGQDVRVLVGIEVGRFAWAGRTRMGCRTVAFLVEEPCRSASDTAWAASGRVEV